LRHDLDALADRDGHIGPLHDDAPVSAIQLYGDFQALPAPSGILDGIAGDGVRCPARERAQA